MALAAQENGSGESKKTHTQAGGATAAESLDEERNGCRLAWPVRAGGLNRRGHVVVLC
jgi:hypothetical protein